MHVCKEGGGIIHWKKLLLFCIHCKYLEALINLRFLLDMIKDKWSLEFMQCNYVNPYCQPYIFLHIAIEDNKKLSSTFAKECRKLEKVVI
jgi:hypothetical protein